MTKHLIVVAYNLDNNRNPTVVHDEVTALCEVYQPDIFIGCEADYHLAIDGYRTVRRGRGASRRNVVILVRKPAFVWRRGWLDLKQTWRRTEHPGTHWPRSFRWVRTRWNGVSLKVLAIHQAPPYVDNTEPAQSEGIVAMVKAMRRAKYAVAAGDWNRRKGERGPGPDVLADAIGGVVVGNRVDCAVAKGLAVVGYEYIESAGGVPLKSDHKHAFVLTLKKEK